MDTYITPREQIATSVLMTALSHVSLGATVLLVDEYTNCITPELIKKNSSYSLWNRRYSPLQKAHVWPLPQPYNTVIIRLPKSHESFDMILQATAQYLTLHGQMIVYGMTDEGIKGAKKKIRNFFGNVETLLFKKRCHVIRAHSNEPLTTKTLTDFAEVCTLQYHNHVYETTFYPGMFAAGTLDKGTNLLLDATIPLLRENIHLLDYGCGSGIVTQILQQHMPSLQCDILDNDVISLAAAKKNCTNVISILADSLKGCDEKKYDVIISNPPMHTEKTEHLSIIENLITSAPQYLSEGGQLIIVVQSRINLTVLFAKHFPRHVKLAQTSQYTVWQGIT